MLQNYFKTAWRTMTNKKVYTFINLLGLTIGLWACMIVATVVMDDLSYDKQWSKGENIYRINTLYKIGDGLYEKMSNSFKGLGATLKNDYPEVEAVAEINSTKQRFKLDENNPNGVEVETLQADTAIWQILDIKVIEGSPRNFTAGSNNLLISESFKNKYFPNINPVGKIINDVPTYLDKPRQFLITGVIKDFPSNTHLRCQAIMLQKGWQESLNKKQFGTFTENYVLMKPGTDISKFEKKLNQWYSGFVESKNPYQWEFQPIKDIYLHSEFSKYQQVKGSYSNIYIFSGVALLVLIIACVNFINLSTARAIQRLKESGVRKILGAGRWQLIFQFLTESFLFFLISTVLATLIYQFSLKHVENFIGHDLAETFVSKFYLMGIAYFIILFLSFLTGFYPAWLMSGFKPAATLKGRLMEGNIFGQNFLRKGLVVLQFTISIAVLVALIVVQQQVSFMHNKDIGFNKNNLLSIASVSWNGKGQNFKNELLNQTNVVSASITSWLPSKGAGFMSREIDNPNHPGNKLKVWYINADVDLAKTLGLHLKTGRFLNDSLSTDKLSHNRMMGLDSMEYANAAKKQHSLITANTAKMLHIAQLNAPIENALTTPVGIVDDFFNESFKTPIQPTIIMADDSMQNGGMLIRIKPGTGNQVMATLNTIWRKYYHDKLFNVQWVDDMLANQYRDEAKLQSLFSFFSSLSMLLAALGIFGLVVQATTQRVKEIGIRKVLGAPLHSIVALFSSDFLKLVFIAILIASPIAWWLMTNWLQGFAYRISINWWVFLLAGGAALFIALATVSVQAIKAARANPVRSLRSE